MKHAQELTFQPLEIHGDIFDKLFETLQIDQLTNEQMETYNKSILKYRDVRSAVELAQERYYERGIEKGREEGRETGLQVRTFEIAKNMLVMQFSINDIVKATGLSPGEIEAIR